jgi:hypothetical protein
MLREVITIDLPVSCRVVTALVHAKNNERDGVVELRPGCGDASACLIERTPVIRRAHRSHNQDACRVSAATRSPEK